MREALALDASEPAAARYYSGVVAGPGVPPERLVQARGFLLAALERKPAEAGLLGALAAVEMNLGNPAAAAQTLEEARRYAPGDIALARRLAAAWTEVGRLEDAGRLLRGLDR